jgi:DNA-binding XRE family transcriptional regulator
METTKKQAVKNLDSKLERVSLAEARDMMYEKFRTNIRVLRAREGWSGCKAGEVIGLKNGKRMINLEYGRANPTMEEMLLISKCFNQSIDDILHKTIKIVFE